MTVLAFLTSLAVWYVIAVFAYNNRFLRDTLYGPKVGALVAHLTGVVLQIGFIYGITYLWLRWLGPVLSDEGVWLIGGLWVLLTAIVEPAFYVRSGLARPEELLADYNVLRGRLWALVLVALLLAPEHINSYLLSCM